MSFIFLGCSTFRSSYLLWLWHHVTLILPPFSQPWTVLLAAISHMYTGTYEHIMCLGACAISLFLLVEPEINFQSNVCRSAIVEQAFEVQHLSSWKLVMSVWFWVGLVASLLGTRSTLTVKGRGLGHAISPNWLVWFQTNLWVGNSSSLYCCV